MAEIPFLDVQNLTKSFGALVLFENISFSVAQGQRVGLIAKNGTGKSTLLSLLAGNDSPDSGNIIFRKDIKVAILEQTPRFDPDDTVLEACFNHKGEEEKVLKAKQVLTQLKIRDLNQPMGQLSGGQQKRVALANVLITEPDLFVEVPGVYDRISDRAELGLSGVGTADGSADRHYTVVVGVDCLLDLLVELPRLSVLPTVYER